MSYLGDLTTARNSLLNKLKDVAADPTLVTYSEGGRSYSFTEYTAMLRKEVDELNKMIIKAKGPVEIRTIVLS